MARYKFLLICFFFLHNSILVQAQNQKISGTIKDSISGELIAGAVIRLGKLGAVSNSAGVFEISLENGSQNHKTIEISYTGYQTQIVPISADNWGKHMVVYLLSSPTLLNQMLVTAGRFEQSVKRQLVSTEVIQPYLISNKNTTMMDDLLDQVPSVNIIDGQINIRSGSGWTYGAGSRVMVLVDGMPFLTGDAGQVKWNFVPIENVKQVEVVKGASSVLYGSSALSGIVHFRTEMTNDKPFTRFSVSSGIYSQPKRNSLVWTNNPLLQYNLNGFHSFKKQNLQVSISGNYFKDNGYRLGETENRLRLNANLKYKTKSNVQYGLNIGALYSDGGSFLLWESYEKGYTILDSNVSNTESKNIYFDPNCTFYTGLLKHTIQGRWMYISNDISNSDSTVNQDNSSKNYYGEYQVQRYFSGIGLNLTSGFVSSQNFSSSPLYNGFQKSRNHAVFLQLDETFFRKLNASIGARYEYFNMNGKAESKPVFRAGINYELAKASFIRASYGQGYRFPSIAEKYIQTSVGLLNVFPNPNLKSETGWNAEIGFKQGFAIKKLKGFLDIAVFYTRYQNMIDFNLGLWRALNLSDPFKSYGFTSLNIGETQIPGLDISVNLEGKIGSVLIQGIMGYTYTNPTMINIDEVFAVDSLNKEYSFRNTRSDSTNILKYRYKHLFKMDLQFSYKKWSLGISSRYNSYMENIDAAFVTTPLTYFIKGVDEARKSQTGGNTVFDMRLSYQVNTKMKLGLVINNLFNAEIMTRPADLRPPRLTMIQFNYQF
ncbi:MAG: TonB-dependent receptor [Bacteroidia bacterium]|nr:TonB-dependent receptor [Bacteroidia bacterium]MCF8428119.1 TonB-dependent receptor [Bacteroidia bacterium]MCF8447727.1 TonB-dependent receptor [Bacteroidia bacterium]